MIAFSGIVVILFPLLILSTLVVLWLIVGVRNTDKPSCRKCGESLALFEEHLVKCPGCHGDLLKKRAVRFSGRRRPLALRLLSCVVVLPTLGIIALLTVFALGIVTPGSIQRMFNPTQISGSITFTNALHLSTDELLVNLKKFPNGPWGWSELHDRMEADPPSDEKMIAIIDTMSDAVTVLNANALANPNLSSPGYDCGRVLHKAIRQLGYGHVRVQEFLNAYLTEPNTCPLITVTKNSLHLNFNPKRIAQSEKPPVNLIKNLFRNNVDEELINNSIRIDGKDIPRTVGKRVAWQRQAISNLSINKKYLPDSALEPGTHTIELTRTAMIHPPGLSKRLEPKDWPSNVVMKTATFECEYTVKEPPARNP